MQQSEIAMMVVKQGDQYRFQLRNGAAQAGALNLIGCFGGKLEPGEKSDGAACRELREESTFNIGPDRTRRLGEVSVRSERHGQPISVRAKVFQVDMQPAETIAATEGELVTMSLEQIHANINKFTPATRAVFTELIEE